MIRLTYAENCSLFFQQIYDFQLIKEQWGKQTCVHTELSTNMAPTITKLKKDSEKVWIVES